MENNNNNNNESSSQQSDWKQRELGALWKKNGRTQNYFSGRINLSKFNGEDFVNIVGFANKLKKEHPNAPDVIIYYSPSSEKSGLDLDSSNQTKPSSVTKDSASKTESTPAVDSNSIDDETPF